MCGNRPLFKLKQIGPASRRPSNGPNLISGLKRKFLALAAAPPPTRTRAVNHAARGCCWPVRRNWPISTTCCVCIRRPDALFTGLWNRFMIWLVTAMPRQEDRWCPVTTSGQFAEGVRHSDFVFTLNSGIKAYTMRIFCLSYKLTTKNNIR